MNFDLLYIIYMLEKRGVAGSDHVSTLKDLEQRKKQNTYDSPLTLQANQNLHLR